MKSVVGFLVAMAPTTPVLAQPAGRRYLPSNVGSAQSASLHMVRAPDAAAPVLESEHVLVDAWRHGARDRVGGWRGSRGAGLLRRVMCSAAGAREEWGSACL